MFEILDTLNHSFKAFLDQGDPRVNEWPMMKTPFPGMAMIAAYIYFVKVAGPQFMKNRTPYDLRWLMGIYNFVLVFLNLWIFWGIGWYGWFNGYSLKCQPVDYSNEHSAVKMAEMGYWFYITKFIEFADTIFFVLRKKDSQISALHVIHHSIVPFSLWFGVKYAPGGYNAFFPFLNSLVHVIMYTYYGLAALGEKYKKYLFWKKYMTYIQMVQFVGVIIYAISLAYNKCDISKTFILMNFIHALLFFGLFLNFFVKNYSKRPCSKSSPISVPSGKILRSEITETVNKDINISKILQKTQKNGGHVSHLVSQMNREAESFRGQLDSGAVETCCHLNCMASRDPTFRKCGKSFSYCLPQALTKQNAAVAYSESSVTMKKLKVF